MVVYSLWGHKGSDTTERLSKQTSNIPEGFEMELVARRIRNDGIQKKIKYNGSKYISRIIR